MEIPTLSLDKSYVLFFYNINVLNSNLGHEKEKISDIIIAVIALSSVRKRYVLLSINII